MIVKPKYKMPSANSPEGNIFVIIGQVRTLLKRSGYTNLAEEMTHRITQGEAKSYEQAKAIISEYVDII